MLSKAQNFSLEDQRGRIDSRNLEIPEFLLTTSNLIKSKYQNQQHHNHQHQSSNASKNVTSSSGHLANYVGLSAGGADDDNNLHPNHGNDQMNKSSISLPLTSSANPNHAYAQNHPHQRQHRSSHKYSHSMHDYVTHQNFSNTISRSRSPYVIVYDNDDYAENLDYNSFNSSSNHNHPNDDTSYGDEAAARCSKSFSLPASESNQSKVDDRHSAPDLSPSSSSLSNSFANPPSSANVIKSQISYV